MVRACVIATLLSLSVAGTGCGPNVNIGGVCESRAECGSGHSCITAAPGGFCTKTCATEGNTLDCPGGTVCTYFGDSALVCSVFCTSDDQCRVNYQCAELKGSQPTNQKACRPVNVKR